MRRRAFLVAVAVLIAALAVWAWSDAGRVPVRDIVEPVAVPELPR
jgi:hypothetical protein